MYWNSKNGSISLHSNWRAALPNFGNWNSSCRVSKDSEPTLQNRDNLVFQKIAVFWNPIRKRWVACGGLSIKAENFLLQYLFWWENCIRWIGIPDKSDSIGMSVVRVPNIFSLNHYESFLKLHLNTTQNTNTTNVFFCGCNTHLPNLSVKRCKVRKTFYHAQ